MSSFIATVSQIQHHQNLHLVRFDYEGEQLSMLSLELPSNIKVKTKVRLSIKPTDLYISRKDTSSLSIANKLPTHIINITHGKLLSSIKLRYKNTIFEVITAKQSILKENYSIGENVLAWMSESDLFISEVLDA